MYLLFHDVEADLFAEKSILTVLNEWLYAFQLGLDVAPGRLIRRKFLPRKRCLLLLDAEGHSEQSLVRRWRIGLCIRRRGHLFVPPGEQSGQLRLCSSPIVTVDSWNALA